MRRFICHIIDRGYGDLHLGHSLGAFRDQDGHTNLYLVTPGFPNMAFPIHDLLLHYSEDYISSHFGDCTWSWIKGLTGGGPKAGFSDVDTGGYEEQAGYSALGGPISCLCDKFGKVNTTCNDW